jgi:hypothetical protein
VSDARDGPWVDGDAGLVRPYLVVDGRTQPSTHFDLMTMVTATGTVPWQGLGPDHSQVLSLCASPATVAEIAAHMHMPTVVVKVLLSDLVEHGAVATRAFSDPQVESVVDIELLEAVLDGLRKRL